MFSIARIFSKKQFHFCRINAYRLELRFSVGVNPKDLSEVFNPFVMPAIYREPLCPLKALPLAARPHTQ
jgi:hypothetical protein